ncbi:MAG: NFACT RNA binding domain-containing protein [Cyanobacteria bacterium P01_F01_bin.150]
MQTVDFTTLYAICAELKTEWVPARLEQVYQCDCYTIAIALRTLKKRGWLAISWHPQAARICITTPPPRVPDTFTFSQQIKHQLGGLALVKIVPLAPWERALDLRFANRPGDPILWHIYVEIMGKYSNAILTNQHNQIVTAAHQVGSQQSSVRLIQTGQNYEFPPPLTDTIPSPKEAQIDWQNRVGLVPKAVWKNLVQTYRGVSPTLAKEIALTAGLNPEQSTETLTPENWEALFEKWLGWLEAIANNQFQPTRLPKGYSVMKWASGNPVSNIQSLIDGYYTEHLNRDAFRQLHHHLQQKLRILIKKLNIKVNDFQKRLHKSDGAEQYKERADLLMAYLHEWTPGLTQMTLTDFVTGQPTKITLDPTKNVIQNAQSLYKRHQKLKRSRQAIEPLLESALAELRYLQQVENAIAQQETYEQASDLALLKSVKIELMNQGYIENDSTRQPKSEDSITFHRYQSPNGFEILVGRNNSQNDHLTFKVATDYDLWFHTQEIPGSHVILRLPAGSIADDADLQYTANLAAYYSRARHSDQAPVIYTQPQYVFKPKGSRPGMVIYKQETVIWGYPQVGKSELQSKA